MEPPTSAIPLLLVLLLLVSQMRASMRESRIPNGTSKGIPFLRQSRPLIPRAQMLKPVDLSERVATEGTVDRKIKKAIHTLLPSNCEDAQIWSQLAHSDTGGVIGLLIPGIGFKNVYCDVGDEGGNWTVFQRRKNGNVDFFRNWADYVNGFGDFENIWLGLEALHQITREGDYELKINMITLHGVHLSAKYRNFRIGPGSSNYILSVSGYSGNATDSLWVHNNHPFTTKDADHDAHPSDNCASLNHGAWWYIDCFNSNLNALLTKDSTQIVWMNLNFPSTTQYLIYSEMKFRRRF